MILVQLGQLGNDTPLPCTVEVEEEGIVDSENAKESLLGNTIEISTPGLVDVLYDLVLLSGGGQEIPARERNREKGKINDERW
jgi:hypothetical protein